MKRIGSDMDLDLDFSNFEKIHCKVSAQPKSRLITISEFLVSLFYVHIYAGGFQGDAIDAGANSGLHTRQLALHTQSNGQRVVAIEPNVTLGKLIRQNCLSEMCKNFEIEKRPLWHNNSRLRFITKNDSQISYAQESRFGKIRGITLDEISRKYSINPIFVKLDTEGNGSRAVASSVEFIRKFRPFMAIECGPWDGAENHLEIFDVLSNMEYSLIDCFGNIFNRENWMMDIPGLYWNRFMIPTEHLTHILPSIQISFHSIWKSFLNEK